MASPIRIKRSAVPLKRPGISDLQLGELALNTYDGKLFTKQDTNGVGIGTTITLLTPWQETYGGSSVYYEGDVGIGDINPTSKLSVDGDVNVSGVVTATTFSGSGASLTSIPNGALDNSTVSYGGIQLSLGGSDATPAFDLSDATNYPYASLTGKPTIGDGTLTLEVSGVGLSGSQSFTANQTGNATFTVTSNATDSNTADTVVSRNSSGDFSANSITLAGQLNGPAEFIIDPAAVGDNTGAVRIKGDLYVDGTTTQINSTTLEIADFVVGIASTATTDLLADGAGIQIGPDNTLLYDHSNTALKSSENFNIASDKTYKIDGTDVLSSTTLGIGVTISNIRSVNSGLIADREQTSAANNDYILFYDVSDGSLKKDTIESASLQGVQGTQGIQGVQGITGTGTPGSPGPAGSPGEPGSPGPSVQGSQGTQGIQGTDGTQGIQGITGTGSPGPAGSPGEPGSPGPSVQGSQGTQGITGTGTPGSPGPTGAPGPSVQGSQGTQGIQGETIQGVQGPSGGGGGGSSLTIQEVAGSGGSTTQHVTSVSTLKFDGNSGFNVTDEGSGEVFIDLGSNFNPWQLVADGGSVSGGTLTASGEEPVQFVAGNGISITSNPNSTPKQIKFVSSGGGGGGGSIAGIDTTGTSYFNHLSISGISTLGFFSENQVVSGISTLSENTTYYSIHKNLTVENNSVLTVGSGSTIIMDRFNNLDDVTANSITCTGSITAAGIDTSNTSQFNNLNVTGISTLAFFTDDLLISKNKTLDDNTTYYSIHKNLVLENNSVLTVGSGSTIIMDRFNSLDDVTANSITCTGTVTAADFNSTSDIKLKQNVEIIDDPLEKIMKIDGVSFQWKESGNRSLGVIAQNIEKILPELVTDGDTKTVNYNGLIGLLIECIKNQQHQINELKDLNINK